MTAVTVKEDPEDNICSLEFHKKYSSALKVYGVGAVLYLHM